MIQKSFIQDKYLLTHTMCSVFLLLTVNNPQGFCTEVMRERQWINKYVQTISHADHYEEKQRTLAAESQRNAILYWGSMTEALQKFIQCKLFITHFSVLSISV